MRYDEEIRKEGETETRRHARNRMIDISTNIHINNVVSSSSQFRLLHFLLASGQHFSDSLHCFLPTGLVWSLSKQRNRSLETMILSFQRQKVVLVKPKSGTFFSYPPLARISASQAEHADSGRSKRSSQAHTTRNHQLGCGSDHPHDYVITSIPLGYDKPGFYPRGFFHSHDHQISSSLMEIRSV